MAHLAFPVGPVGPGGSVNGREPARFTTVSLQARPGRLLRDFRHLITTSGTITDRVMLKVNATTEQPFANGRVWLLRLADGYKAWEGWSDAAGYYTATGLEIGVDYVAVAIDPARNHKTTGAGPVTAA